jgi:hypothetical protein
MRPHNVHSYRLALNGPVAEDVECVGDVPCFVGRPGRTAVVTNRVFSKNNALYGFLKVNYQWEVYARTTSRAVR